MFFIVIVKIKIHDFVATFNNSAAQRGKTYKKNLQSCTQENNISCKSLQGSNSSKDMKKCLLNP